MSKLKVDEIRSADRSVSSTANITLADNGSTTIPNGTLSAGTIGSGVDFPQTGYAQLDNVQNASQTGVKINFGTITGDTTNITKDSSTFNIQLALAGIYLIQINCTFTLTTSERACRVKIFDGSDTQLAVGLSALGVEETGTNFAFAGCSYTGSFSANSEIYFNTQSFDGGNVDLDTGTHASICLIKPA